MLSSTLRTCTLLTAAFGLVSFMTFADDQKPAPTASSLEGRWDLSVQAEGKTLPSWLEVTHSGHSTLVGRFVGSSGSARPISKVNFTDGKISFSIPPQWERADQDLVVNGMLEGDKLTGTMVSPNGKTLTWTGVRAPSLAQTKSVTWGKTTELFNGKDLKGWHAMGETNQWVVENGVLKSPKSGSNIQTDQAFSDFKLHIEFKYPKGSNSGVYLRGRYEVQIVDSKGMEPQIDMLGAVYGFLTPNELPDNNADEWQSYDITLVGRRVTVALNGKTIICDTTIPGITGGAIDSKEGEPGPIYLQGDHGPIEFRNIRITLPK
ncbi:hypothetical protein BWI96_05185 [Siphonobacter sp. SORGH_AS_0500]|uniref:3-keto-disaccharide hydrolase n=1 Tax=Siphonobacter sp. SORGH_AS_0500 TaxID=1864824 RepID=UPI000CC90EC9|nr:DUF1080 domain-containing protein [Siphonobacter sp. SORGH_AS_0500]PKK37855.1 hypothetical protein BWI96_05185 [Siphonobacter sp. SORGH_AS_0500]